MGRYTYIQGQPALPFRRLPAICIVFATIECIDWGSSTGTMYSSPFAAAILSGVTRLSLDFRCSRASRCNTHNWFVVPLNLPGLFYNFYNQDSTILSTKV